MKLYSYWRSSSSWRVRWTLLHKEISFETIPVNLLKGEQRADSFALINPSRAVPALEIQPQTVLTESVAILEWIEENFKQKPLLPNDSLGRARVRTLVETINSGIQPLQNLKVLQRISEQDETRRQWAQQWVRDGLRIYDEKARPFQGLYSYGDALTLADVFLIPQLYNAKRQNIDVPSEFPNLQKIMNACETLESYEKSRPENQIDAVMS